METHQHKTEKEYHLLLHETERKMLLGSEAQMNVTKVQQELQLVGSNREFMDTTLVQKLRLEKNYRPNEKTVKSAVVVVSSLPRSGSTFLAELLTSHHSNGTVLFFEPLMLYQKKLRQHNTSFVEQFLSGLLACDFSSNFEVWLKGKSLFLSYYHPSVERCFRKPAGGGTKCMRRLDLLGVCRQANTRVVKVIRSRLSWLAGLLDDPGALQVKLIHLIRDPRASMTSARKLGWNSDPTVKCTAVYDDLEAYDNLSARYPGRILQVSHESMCLDPLTTTKTIFHFIHGSSNLEPSTVKFLRRHTESSSSSLMSARKLMFMYDDMDTRRQSWREYDAWRWEISNQQLQMIEKEKVCRDVLERLSHVVFGSIKNARNASVSLQRKQPLSTS